MIRRDPPVAQELGRERERAYVFGGERAYFFGGAVLRDGLKNGVGTTLALT
jgi:hypothetical protein